MGIYGSVCRVQGARLRMQGLSPRAQGSEIGGKSLGFRVSGLG
jgi:hypothetical protein